jgi:hypothetical protein
LPGDRHASGRLPQGPGPVSDSELVFVLERLCFIRKKKTAAFCVPRRPHSPSFPSHASQCHKVCACSGGPLLCHVGRLRIRRKNAKAASLDARRLGALGGAPHVGTSLGAKLGLGAFGNVGGAAGRGFPGISGGGTSFAHTYAPVSEAIRLGRARRPRRSRRLRQRPRRSRRPRRPRRPRRRPRRPRQASAASTPIRRTRAKHLALLNTGADQHVVRRGDDQRAREVKHAAAARERAVACSSPRLSRSSWSERRGARRVRRPGPPPTPTRSPRRSPRRTATEPRPLTSSSAPRRRRASPLFSGRCEAPGRRTRSTRCFASWRGAAPPRGRRAPWPSRGSPGRI